MNSAKEDYLGLDDASLVRRARDKGIGAARGLAIETLAERALAKPALIDTLCSIISEDRAIGFHAIPLGWIGADIFYLSGQEGAIRSLLDEMGNWNASEQEDLVRHWAGKGRLASLTERLGRDYGWKPRYKPKPGSE